MANNALMMQFVLARQAEIAGLRADNEALAAENAALREELERRHQTDPS